ncbi:MAG: DUF2817 domain-containing protein [Methylotetracoccus sp.]|jgi:hypothetical protein|nr:DUF2817 domain-containing protein [Methylotetracoccus sp.]
MNFPFPPPGEAASSPAALEGLLDQLEGKPGFPELVDLLSLAVQLEGLARVEVLGTVSHGRASFPLIAIRLGAEDRTTPVLALFGGVHGLERIGTRIVLSYLRTLMELARWDRVTREMLKTTRIVLFPLVNPVGMYLQRRSNGNGVDLMRNSPVRAQRLDRWHLFGGHRISPRLPWYQGREGEPMEIEAQALCDFVRREVFPAQLALAVDVHSGYGKLDRFWFPYAKTRDPFPHVPEVVALKQLLDKTYPHHIYRIEPQSTQYVTHGDLWDYLYEEFQAERPGGHFIPFTLELGSWLWVKKNWRQVFFRSGAFNPWLPHREQRTLRRHMILFDFLYRAVQSPEPWLDLGDAMRQRLLGHGLRIWYAG